MKKAVSLLTTVLMLLCAVQTFAFADIVDPFPSPSPEKTNSMLPIILITVAIVVAAVVIWRVRRQKK